MKLCVFLYASLFFISFSIGHFRLFLIYVLGLWPSLMELNRCWQLLIAFLKYYAYGLLDTGCPQGLCLCIANAVQDKGVNPDFGMGRSCGLQEILYLIMYNKDLGTSRLSHGFNFPFNFCFSPPQTGRTSARSSLCPTLYTYAL